jgi:hypothetical protein
MGKERNSVKDWSMRKEGLFTKDNLMKEKGMDLVLLKLLIVLKKLPYILVNLSMETSTEKENKLIKLVYGTRDNGRRTKGTVLEN